MNKHHASQSNDAILKYNNQTTNTINRTQSLMNCQVKTGSRSNRVKNLTKSLDCLQIKVNIDRNQCEVSDL
jgi:hypothetical protein